MEEHPADPRMMRLEAQLCFALHAASRALDGVYRRELRDLGLTYPQYLVMLVLWERQPLSVKELGAALRLDSGTLSPLLKRLEAAGLVARGRSTADERSVLVRPTADGAALRARAALVPERILAATGLQAGEIAQLRQVLGRVTATLDAGLPAAAPLG
ncbi:MarR family transcriptional regulator [Sphaerisporangium sp. TRM90804]|uniref:MarR family winged helix-turn-helix transcriptional regulator n=1 Tax=Sphaerisporangium sp. TRM90804 TaxID=3031113 RepID=UPI0024498B56|nr:MarR family transcriptional regulator [Sphaerisporangium sp. TRM90804]MDH2425884.1 MarR family transcriptional regulator [Sphaerisporangium sp. TRM90804]